MTSNGCRGSWTDCANAAPIGASARPNTPGSCELGSPRSISNSGLVVGTGQVGPGQPGEVPWIWGGGVTSALEYRGLAADVNESGQVAGTRLQDGSERAIVWHSGEVHEYGPYEEEPGWRNTGASAINDIGVAAGSIRRGEHVPGHPDELAAVFSDDGIAVLRDLPVPAGGRAQDVNNAGRVLVALMLRPFDVRSIVWNPIGGTWEYVGDDSNNVYPIDWTEDGRILGQARDKENEPLAVLAELGSSWQIVGTPAGWVATGMNQAGDIIGWTKVEGLQKPWIRRASGEVVWLPYPRQHHTAPSRVNDNGVVIGHASADHGGHALMWSLP